MAAKAKVIVRTGAFDPWGNILLYSGVDVPAWFAKPGVVAPDYYAKKMKRLMPRIFDFGGRDVERSQTLPGSRAQGHSGSRAAQVTAETADEAAAAEAAGIEMVVCRAANRRARRDGSTRVFVTAALGFAEAVTADEILRAAFAASPAAPTRCSPGGARHGAHACRRADPGGGPSRLRATQIDMDRIGCGRSARVGGGARFSGTASGGSRTPAPSPLNAS